MVPRLVVASCGLSGCSGELGTFDDVPIEEAWLEQFSLSSFAIIGGTLQGDALLGFTEPGGTSGSLPVHLGGGVVGVALDMAWDAEGHEGFVDIDLTDVDSPMVSDVLGDYHGSGSGGAVIVGASHRRMQNDAGATFREDHFVALGLSMFVGYEWLTIRQGGNDGP